MPFLTTSGQETPPALLLPRLRSSLKASDVDGFFYQVGEVLQIQMNAQGGEAPDGAVPFYVHTFPKERLSTVDQPFDGITWKVLSSVMAPTDNSGNRVPRKPSTIEVKPSKLLANYNVVSQLWTELATAEFTIWSKSSDTRSKLLTWFHKTLMRYANVLQFFDGRGISMFQYVGRGEDNYDTVEQQEVHYGTLTYQYRVQAIDVFRARQLTSITAGTSIENGSDELIYTLPAEDIT